MKKNLRAQKSRDAVRKPALIGKDKFGLDVLTAAGKRSIRDYVTDVDGDVYALNNMSEEMASTAMARLSRSAEDVRVILAREFIGQEDRVAEVGNRIVNEFGDDSVKDLGGGLKVIVVNASNLLTKHLERGRLAGYIEQSTRYIYFDRRGPDGKFRYHTPATLDSKTAKQFENFAVDVFETYSRIVHATTEHIRNTHKRPSDIPEAGWNNVTRAQACDAARLLLPVATRSIVGITGSAHSYEGMIITMQGSDNAEARHVGAQILVELRKLIPVLLAKADNPDRGGATSAYKATTRKATLALTPQEKLQPQKMPTKARLIDYYPKKELELVAHMLYQGSNLSLSQLSSMLKNWSETQLINAFKTYVGERYNRRHRPDRAIEVAQYIWDIVCDYGIFRDLQRHRLVDALEWQNLHPFFGYEIPALLKEAGFNGEAERLFDESQRTYEMLIKRGYLDEAQYATLLGHKMRWKVAFNAREAFHLLELRTQPSGHPGYIKLCQQMYETIRTVHPRLAKAMIFINTKGETDELTRLGETRALQRKLELMSPGNKIPKSKSR